jgi:hypothetical protein
MASYSTTETQVKPTVSSQQLTTASADGTVTSVEVFTAVKIKVEVFWVVTH